MKDFRIRCSSLSYWGMEMNALTNTQPTMSSREIAELTKKDHPNVLRDARAMLEELGEDVFKFEGIYLDAYGRKQPCLNLPKDLTITLVAGYNVQVRHAIVKRWQELESKNFQVPTTLSGALRLAAEQAELIEKQQIALDKAAPKVAHFDLVVEKSNLLTATQVGQKVGMSGISLNKVLEELDVYHSGVKRSRVFKQWFINKKLGELKQTENGYTQALFTIAGEAWVINQLTIVGVI